MLTLIDNEIDYAITEFITDDAAAPTHSEGASILPSTSGMWPQLDIVVDGVELLDSCYSLMFEGRVGEAMDRLIPGLATLRYEYADVADDWRYFAQTVCREHPIAELIGQDPIAREAAKNRASGPAADMIDLLFGIDGTGEDVTRLGAAIYTSTSQIQSARSLRSRREILAKRIEEVAAKTKGARILVVGSGHLREAQLANLVEAELEAFVAVDSNEKALEVVAREQENVEVVSMSVRSLMLQSSEFYDFDLVYAPSVFDSLPVDEARRLMELMFTMLRPGGRVIVANFANDWLDAGFREAFLNWRTVPRTEDELVALTKGIPSKAVAQVRLYCDEGAHSNFIELFRK